MEYIYKIYCELIITSKSISLNEINERIKINAHRSYNKGDLFVSKHSGKKGKRVSNLWAIKSALTISEEEDITPHINYFKNTLYSKKECINKFKIDPESEVDFWIWIEADEVGFSLEVLDLDFLNSISNCLHISAFPVPPSRPSVTNDV